MVIIPPSTVTFTSSFFTAGSAARIRYSFSVSLISAEGAHSSFVPPSPSADRRGMPLNDRRSIRSNTRSISLNGSQRIRLILFLLLGNDADPVLSDRPEAASVVLRNHPDSCADAGRHARSQHWQRSRLGRTLQT